MRAGLFDPRKEADRLTKQRDKLAGEIQGMDARLSNQSFVSKAPEKVRTPVHSCALLPVMCGRPAQRSGQTQPLHACV